MYRDRASHFFRPKTKTKKKVLLIDVSFSFRFSSLVLLAFFALLRKFKKPKNQMKSNQNKTKKKCAPKLPQTRAHSPRQIVPTPPHLTSPPRWWTMMMFAKCECGGGFLVVLVVKKPPARTPAMDAPRCCTIQQSTGDGPLLTVSISFLTLDFCFLVLFFVFSSVCFPLVALSLQIGTNWFF